MNRNSCSRSSSDIRKLSKTEWIFLFVIFRFLKDKWHDSHTYELVSIKLIIIFLSSFNFKREIRMGEWIVSRIYLSIVLTQPLNQFTREIATHWKGHIHLSSLYYKMSTRRTSGKYPHRVHCISSRLSYILLLAKLGL